MGKLTKSEQKIKDAIDRQLYRYYKAILARGDSGAIKEYERTMVKFDPNFKPSGNNPEEIAMGCHNCNATHASESSRRPPKDPNHDTIILGPRVITDLGNPKNSSYQYPIDSGHVFHPGPNGPLEMISHEFGHTFKFNSELMNAGRPGMAEENASQYMDSLRPYFPPQ